MLKQWDAADGALRHAIHCPQCHSSRVEFPQFSRRIAGSFISALLCALGLMKRKFYCEDCHYTWPVQPEKREPTDPLGWPQGKGFVPNG